jgi:asparagine synthase (glutamine-hydrolysing)
MCGIVGFVSQSHFEALTEKMPEALSGLVHRGPDDSGLFLDEEAGVGLGHRRLAILDLSPSGRQPMASEDGKVQIVYNGEVYNFQEIREALEGYGFYFQTRTDTEVILKAYLHWGIECLDRFVGMFAFALWDLRTRCLILARDRLGIKPIYYHLSGGNLFFASELKALMVFKEFPKNLDIDAIPLFLHYQYIPTPRTIFKDTFKLQPGHYATFKDNTFQIQSYWEIPDGQLDAYREDVNENYALEELDYLLNQSVADRLVSDVPLGALLSGGVDSSAVVAAMQKVNNSSVRTFTIGFREPNYDEAPWASKVAKHLGTDHTELYVTSRDALDVIPKLPEIYDEPFGDSSAIPTHLVCRLVRSQVTVALSGDGGDEQFSGYVRYWTVKAIANSLLRLPNAAKAALRLLLSSVPSTWVEKCYLPWRHILPQRFSVVNFHDKWQRLTKLTGQTEISDLYRMAISLWPEDELYSLLGRVLPECKFEEAFRETEGLPLLARLMRVDQKTYLPDAMLTKVDRASMAASLEVRVPLLDHRVVEYTSKLSDTLKYKNGKGKYLLRKLLARYLPTNLFERPKMGFGVPIDHWFRTDLKPLLLDYLSPVRLKEEGLFDQELVEKKIKEHLSGKLNHKDCLWSLFVWEMWRERWLGGL